MKRIIIVAIAILLMAGLFFICRAQVRRDQPEEGETKFALCTAHVYEDPALTGEVEVLASLHKGDEFTLTGRRASADNGNGARYPMWEGTTADGTVGWVKANAFTSTDYHGW